MPYPKKWRVAWDALGDTPAGFVDFDQRAQARGFYMIRKASGFRVSINPVF